MGVCLSERDQNATARSFCLFGCAGRSSSVDLSPVRGHEVQLIPLEGKVPPQLVVLRSGHWPFPSYSFLALKNPHTLCTFYWLYLFWWLLLWALCFSVLSSHDFVHHHHGVQTSHSTPASFVVHQYRICTIPWRMVLALSTQYQTLCIFVYLCLLNYGCGTLIYPQHNNRGTFYGTASFYLFHLVFQSAPLWPSSN